jgi:hypothetical protein
MKNVKNDLVEEDLVLSDDLPPENVVESGVST